jgi:hypothetical protein
MMLRYGNETRPATEAGFQYLLKVLLSSAYPISQSI